MKIEIVTKYGWFGPRYFLQFHDGTEVIAKGVKTFAIAGEAFVVAHSVSAAGKSGLTVVRSRKSELGDE